MKSAQKKQPLPQLTIEQQAVVAHGAGAALVFAVAGAGKTTAMVHRIERLVREGVCAPEQILATSFAKANVTDLEVALRRWPHCRAVATKTFHALGRQVIVQAQRLGYARGLNLNGNQTDPDNISQTLLNQTVAQARHANLSFVRELDGLDRQDFLDYVGRCKGNLQYADLAGANLSKNGRRLAHQAVAPSDKLDWYLDLYILFEQVRLQQGGITFDDMLLTSWELLVTHPDLLAQVQSQYRYVLVDEFQDINRAQSELLDLITQPQRHDMARNYMAIGDDDQTIYEWRGANPAFILNFAKRYKAATFVMRDNFRCPAWAVSLANEVIKHNKQRQVKQLQLTCGFVGQAHMGAHDTLAEMATAVINDILSLKADGASWIEMAILVRIHAQTPLLEQALISHEVPYWVERPFYSQIEIKTLIAYGRVAWLNKRLQNGLDITLKMMSNGLKAWRQIVHRPKRYISKKVSQRVEALVRQKNLPFSDAILEVNQWVEVEKDYLRSNLEAMALDLEWLADSLEADAGQTLRQLDRRLGYGDYWLESSGLAQTGQTRAANVDTFIEYAQGRGSLLEFMGHIRQLEVQKMGKAKGQTAVSLSTIHGAKGLEWEHVFIPQCNLEILPFNGRQADNMEEERRLFYVALTRTKQTLHLYTLKDDPLSPFLQEAKWQKVWEAVKVVRDLLAKDVATWPAAEVLQLVQLVVDYDWQRFFEVWWVRDTAVLQKMVWFVTAVRQHKLQRSLKLKDDQLDFWQSLDPTIIAPASSDFPDIATLTHSPPKAAKIRSKGVRAGMWLQCDAGLGKIESITNKAGKRLQKVADLQASPLKLRVILRPEADGELVEIDTGAKTITFLNASTIYTCALCDQFTAAQSRTIEREHSRAVHDDVFSFRKEKGRKRPLTLLELVVDV